MLAFSAVCPNWELADVEAGRVELEIKPVVAVTNVAIVVLFEVPP